MSTLVPAGFAGEPPPPSFTRTYRPADGDPASAEGIFWVTDPDTLDGCETYPVELVEETWERTGVRRVWRLPDELYACERELAAGVACEEDADAWEQLDDGSWVTVCAAHHRDESGERTVEP